MHELKKVGEEIFLDRDGSTFQSLINYLRNERKVFPDFQDKQSENSFYKELHYWGIDREHRKWQEEYLLKLDILVARTGYSNAVSKAQVATTTPHHYHKTEVKQLPPLPPIQTDQ